MVGHAEYSTHAEEQEISNFLQEISKTSVIQKTLAFLAKKGLFQALRQMYVVLDLECYETAVYVLSHMIFLASSMKKVTRRIIRKTPFYLSKRQDSRSAS